MYKFYSFRRSEEVVTNGNWKGTAIDCSCDGETLVVGDCCEFFRVNVDSASVVETHARSNHKPVHLLKCHPHAPTSFAAVSGASIEFVEDGRLRSIAQGSRVSDFDFDPFDENLSARPSRCPAVHSRLQVSASEASINFWDRRELKRPANRVPVLFGARQAKFSPVLEHTLLSAHGSDLRIWDLRNMLAPTRQFIATQNERITALELHPLNPNVMLTSSADSIKLWDCSEEMPNFVVLGHQNVGKFRFSLSGEIFVSLNFPSNASMENSVCLWQLNAFGNAQGLRRNVAELYKDLCWLKQKDEDAALHYLFTLSERGGLLKHLVISNTTNEPVERMSIPRAQTAQDEARDRLLIFGSKAAERADDHQQTPEDLRPLHKPPDEITESERTWSIWVFAPHLPDTGDLLTELRALRNFDTPGLTTCEVNFQRAAVGISYSHPNLNGRLVIEIRFHRNFMNNGWILLEIVRQHSPLGTKEAADLLRRLRAEAEEQATLTEARSTVLWRTLRALPRLLQDFVDTSETMPQMSGSELGELDARRMFPIGYRSSPFDEWTPSPRLCGARFNRAGLLMVFGQAEVSFKTANPDESIVEYLGKGNGERKAKRSGSRGSSAAISENIDRISSMTEKAGDERRNSRTRNGSLLVRPADSESKFPHSMNEFYSFVSPQHIHYVLQFASERNTGDETNRNPSLSVPFSFETRSNPESERADGRQRVSSVPLEEQQPSTSTGSLVKTSKSATIVSPTHRRRRGSSMTSSKMTNESTNSVEPQFSAIVQAFDGSPFLPVSRTLASKYRLFGGSAAQLAYHNLWQVIRFAPHRQELISLWQLLYEFFNAEEEGLVRSVMEREYRSDGLKTKSSATRIGAKQSTRGHTLARSRVLDEKESLECPSTFHPCGREFLFFFVDFYYANFDVQTAALISCILTLEFGANDVERNGYLEFQRMQKPHKTSRWPNITHFIPRFFHTSHKSGEKSVEELASQRHKCKEALRSLSRAIGGEERNEFESTPIGSLPSTCNERKDSVRVDTPPKRTSSIAEQPVEAREYTPYLTLVDKTAHEETLHLQRLLKDRLDRIRMEYVTLLTRWELLNQRTEVLKFCGEEDSDFKQIARPAFCDVCDEPIKGLVTVCSLCGHGGHPLPCWKEWFETFELCPTMCGCRCLT